MSGSKLFTNLGEKVDKTLESLFGTSSGPVSRPVREEKPVNEDEESEEQDDEEISEASDNDDFDDETEDVDELLKSLDAGDKKKRKRTKDDDGEIEDKYLQKLSEEMTKDDKKKEQKKVKVEEQKNTDTEGKSSEESKPQSILPNESEVEKSENTVFVGNLKNSVITKKSDYKVLKRLFSEHGKVKSIRFRSVAFSEMLPRKAAFIKHQFHDSRDTVNAYVVYEDKSAVSKALKLNGEVFMENHLRVDSVAHPAKHENKRSVFVGNLDFEATEEPLWNHFADCGEIEYVRLIRDSKTNVGKGFGYVQFKDPVSIPKALLLDGKKMEGPKGRKLRITRAKNIKKTADTFKSKSDKKARLTNEEKTKLGRAKAVLGKSGRAQIDNVIEGTRAKAGETVPGLKVGGSRGKSKNKKKPRIRSRSSAFKKNTKK